MINRYLIYIKMFNHYLSIIRLQKYVVKDVINLILQHMVDFYKEPLEKMKTDINIILHREYVIEEGYLIGKYFSNFRENYESYEKTNMHYYHQGLYGPKYQLDQYLTHFDAIHYKTKIIVEEKHIIYKLYICASLYHDQSNFDRLRSTVQKNIKTTNYKLLPGKKNRWCVALRKLL